MARTAADHTRRDAEFMDLALRLARKGRDLVSPNPLVGAVLVKRGEVVGRGWHRRFGGPHAEVEAIRDAGAKRARGATMYVTLEPCAHTGKTPPCSAAIVEAGIRRVFYASRDPNPDTRGRGPRHLRRAGIEVRAKLREGAALALNAPYFHWRATGRPWVILKWAMTADGKIATRTGDSRWITGEKARAFVHRLRRRVDAVLVGTETLRRDDPNLLPRPARGRQPLRVILDRRGTLPWTLQVFADDGTRRLYVTGAPLSARRAARLERLGIDILVLPPRSDAAGRLLDALGARDVSQVLVEGGGRLAGSLLDAALVDELVAFVSPKVIGGAEAPGPVAGKGVELMARAMDVTELEIRRFGRDVCLHGIVQKKTRQGFPLS